MATESADIPESCAWATFLDNHDAHALYLLEKNEAKTYFLVGDFFGKDFKLNKLELTTYGATSNLDDSFNPKILPRQKYLNYKIYTRETDLGNKMLDDEQANVRKYLNKILEHKKSLKD